MSRIRGGFGLLLGVLIAAFGLRDARAQTEPPPVHILRMATLVPQTQPLRRGLALWNRALRDQTDGRVQVRMYWGGSMGDERSMVRRMRIGSLDGASLTSNGLGIIYRPVVVMQVPGLFQTYEQVDRVREGLGPELERGMQEQGFRLLGWGDSGRIRLFSTEPVRRPSDLRRMRPWVPREDAVFTHVLGAAGANGITLSIGEVYGGLRTGMIDVVPGTALAVAALQWFTSVRYVTGQSDGFLVGGMVIRDGFFTALSQADQDAVFETARAQQAGFRQIVREGDERAYEGLVQHGLRPIDLTPHRAEWETLTRQARERMAGRVFPRPLLERVEQLAAGP